MKRVPVVETAAMPTDVTARTATTTDAGTPSTAAADAAGHLRGVVLSVPGIALAALAIAGAIGCAPHRLTHVAVQRCVDRSENDRRDCFRDCEGDFEDAFVACYGGPSPCTTDCRNRQLACQAAPLRDLNLCSETPNDPRSCQSQLRGARDSCVRRPDRAACEEDARRRAAECWQSCQRTSGPALQQCAQTFTRCLDACVPR